MTRPAVIIDCETTGLDPARHEVWEVAAIERDTGTEHLWRMKPDLAKADPQALMVGRYYERTKGMCSCRPIRAWDLASTGGVDDEWSSPPALAGEVARLLDGATLLGAVLSFDTGFLSAFLRAHGEAPTWHYRIRDIGSMAYGYLCSSDNPGYRTPLIDAGTDDFARALGVDLEKFERHSALGDCLLVAAMLDVIEGGTS